MVSFWDFGGQAVMHSMHEFFLGHRCLYIIVLDGRRDEEPEHWLDIISQYGHNSSVIVVMNKVDQNETIEIDRQRLLREYKDVFKEISFHLVSCKTGSGMERFKADLYKRIADMESCKKVFPGRWYRIREKLADLKDDTGKTCNYIREEQFRKICAEEEILDRMPQDTLLKWMNDLGVCFSYHSKGYIGAVDEMKVLRPEWITNGVYKIINSKEAKDNNGFISHKTIKHVLDREDDVNPRYRNTEMDFILGMMRDFKLSYQVEDYEFIPMLTTDSEPDMKELRDAVHLQIEYKVPIPAYVLYNFIVQMRSDVDRSKTWKKGVLLNNPYRDSHAIVRFGRNKSLLDIYVAGTHKTDYLSVLRRTLDSLQRKMEISFSEYIIYKVEDRTARLNLERLIKMLRKGKEEDYADEIDQDVNLIDVLSTIAPDEVINKLRQIQKANQDEIKQLKANNLDIQEMRKMIFNINDQTSKITDQIHEFTALLETITLIQTQLDDIINLFSEIQKDNKDPEILRMVELVLAEAQKGNATSLKKSLIQFVGIAGSVASLWGPAVQLMEIIGSVLPK